MKLKTTIAAGYFTVIGLVAVVGVVGLLGLYQYAASVENGTAATRLSLAMGEVRALEWSALRGDLSASADAQGRLASIVDQFATRGMAAEQASADRYAQAFQSFVGIEEKLLAGDTVIGKSVQQLASLSDVLVTSQVKLARAAGRDLEEAEAAARAATTLADLVESIRDGVVNAQLAEMAFLNHPDSSEITPALEALDEAASLTARLPPEDGGPARDHRGLHHIHRRDLGGLCRVRELPRSHPPAARRAGPAPLVPAARHRCLDPVRSGGTYRLGLARAGERHFGRKPQHPAHQPSRA